MGRGLGPGARIVLVLVSAIVLLVGAALVAVSSAHSTKPLDDYVARVKAAGGPTTTREALGPDPAPDTNGAPELVAALKRAGGEKIFEREWRPVGAWIQAEAGAWLDAMTDAERRDLRSVLQGLAPFFAAAADAVRKPVLRPNPALAPDLEDWPATAMPTIRLLAAQSIAAPNPDDRLAATETLAWLGRRVECRHWMDGFVASVAMQAAAHAVRYEARVRGGNASVWRARLDEPFRGAWLPRFGPTNRVDRVRLIEHYASCEYDGFDFVPRNAPRRSLMNTLERRFERSFEDLFGIDEGSRWTPARIARHLAAREPFDSAPSDSYPRLARSIAEAAARLPEPKDLETLVTTARLLAETDARCRLARIALAAAEHRAKKGELPTSLDELRPLFSDGVPLDPFTDGSFVYERTATGVRIASAGCLAEVAPLDDAALRERGLVWELKR